MEQQACSQYTVVMWAPRHLKHFGRCGAEAVVRSHPEHKVGAIVRDDAVLEAAVHSILETPPACMRVDHSTTEGIRIPSKLSTIPWVGTIRRCWKAGLLAGCSLLRGALGSCGQCEALHNLASAI